MAKHSARGLSNSKEEMAEWISWTSQMIRGSGVTFLLHFIFRTFPFSHFSFHLCLFLLFLTAIDLVMCAFVRNIVVILWQECSCLSLGDALAFFTPWYFITPGNVFLYYTLWTKYNSSLGVWKNTMSICWLFICPFVLEIFF